MIIHTPTHNRKGKKFKTRKKTSGSPLGGHILNPTEEYLAMPDGPVRGQDGRYRVIDALERLRNRDLLQPDHPGMNEAMYLAALKLRDLYTRSGWTEKIPSLDLDRVIGGNHDPVYGIVPITEEAVDARKEFRHCMRVIGWYLEFPFLGCGRTLVEVCCKGRTVAEAALTCTNCYGERAKAITMDKLRSGLMMLVDLWRLSRADAGVNKRSYHRSFAPLEI